MPAPQGAKKASTSIFAKYGAKINAVVKAHAEDQTDYGFVPLPPGIRNGVCQLIKSYFAIGDKEGSDLKGHVYWRGVGVLVDVPNNPELRSYIGQQTSQMVFCCDTKSKKDKVTTQEENVASVLNHFRMLMGDEYTKGAGADDLEALAAGMFQGFDDQQNGIGGPFFYINTRASLPTKEYPDPKTWEDWNGNRGLENYVVPDMTKSANDDATAAGGSVAADAGTTAGDAAPFSEFEDVGTLLTNARAGELVSQGKLQELCVANGMTEDEYAAADWYAVETFLSQGAAGAASEEWKPEVGQIYATNVPLIDPKTKKPAIDPKTKQVRTQLVRVKIATVDEAGRLVDCTNEKDVKIKYAKVSWDALETPPEPTA